MWQARGNDGGDCDDDGDDGVQVKHARVNSNRIGRVSAFFQSSQRLIATLRRFSSKDEDYDDDDGDDYYDDQHCQCPWQRRLLKRLIIN